ncbi:hypothetical protein [Subtercola lobariae]|uniref:PucR C-terminal helix-turn-helix domain-containing protein n=1 Tax=Subtercola lobariae TaxID=1588641 RepID=A0A917EWE8_9MICO|nr:hypothetical protein [Subtercola lobariae]GGF16003.1 hypothetical protein GCM10011399_07280 [Subtercola lobariae]
MKELAGKLTALDPEASAALTVITYFDTLLDGRVSVETLLRGAATLSGVAAGYRRDARWLRVLADGQRGAAVESASYPVYPAGTDAVVWIERDGPAHANDPMIGERLALAVALTTTGHADDSPLRRSVEVLLSGATDDRQRLEAAGRLRLDPAAAVRAVALTADAVVRPGLPTALLTTPWGIVRGAIVPADAADVAEVEADTVGSGAGAGAKATSAAARAGVGVGVGVKATSAAGAGPDAIVLAGGRSGAPVTRTALGLSGPVAALPDSWRSAVITLVLADGTHPLGTHPLGAHPLGAHPLGAHPLSAHPLSRADDLGPLLHLAELVDGRSEVPHDVVTLDQLVAGSWSIEALQALADGASIRAVASAAGLHHSSVHARMPELASQLGYDPLSPLGRTRLYVGLLLRRLVHGRIGA